MGKKVSVVILVLVFLAVALPASGAITATNVEIRGTIASEDASAGGINLSANPASITWSPQSFTGFYYDLKDNLGTEVLDISTAPLSDGQFTVYNRRIPKSALTYSTTGQPKLLKVVDQQFPDNISGAISAGLGQAGTGQSFENGYYTILGWQTQPYIALNGKVDKLAPLIIEQGAAESDKKTLQVGETWNVGSGWILTVNSINNASTPKQVSLSLSKDGVEKNVTTINEGKIYTYVEPSIANETNVPLFVTYIDSIVADTPDYVQLRYTWAIDTNVTEIRSSDTYGVFKNANVAGKTLTLKNDDIALILTRDSTRDLMGELKFKVADSDMLRFYPVVIRDQPGTYEVRGTVASSDASTGSINLSANPTSITWSPQNFAGFYYDLKDNQGTEVLDITTSVVSDGQFTVSSRRIPKGAMTYSTVGQPKPLKVVDQLFSGNIAAAINAGLEQAGPGRAFENGYYTMLGWQTQPYVALNGKVDKLSQLVIEQGTAATDKKTLQVGETWDIGGGWTVTANSIDAKATPRQVWFTLSLNGVKRDDKVIAQGHIYTFTEKSLLDETDVPVFLTYVDSVFAGATTDMVQLRYTWAISESVTKVSSSDTYGVFKNANVVGKTLMLKNDDTSVTLSRGSTQDLMGELKFKVADNDTLRFYPSVTYEISSPSPPSLPQPFDTLRFEPDAWNLVSTPKTLVDPAVDTSFANLSSDVNNVKWFYDTSANISTWRHPNNIMPLDGYWVYNNASSVILQKLVYKNISGPNVPPSTTLRAGWNLIGHTATEPMPVRSALISIDGKYSHLLTYDPVQGWKMYIVGNPSLQQFDVFEPGRGYWIFMTQDSTYAAVSV